MWGASQPECPVLAIAQFNVCGTMPVCGTLNGKPASGCEAETQTDDLKTLKPERLVGLEKTLQLSTEGFITLTYEGLHSTTRGKLTSGLLLSRQVSRWFCDCNCPEHVLSAPCRLRHTCPTPAHPLLPASLRPGPCPESSHGHRSLAPSPRRPSDRHLQFLR